MDVYPLTIRPIYKQKIWGGRNLERLFSRELPERVPVGESWELADLNEGVCVVTNGSWAGRTLTDVTRKLGADLLGNASAMPDGRFPLLLKFLDANDILSLQVHPDAAAAAEIGEGAAPKTECWYVVESRDGFIYKGIAPGVTAESFQEAIEAHTVEDAVKRYDCVAGDFHYLPAGTVHAIGGGLLVAEVQTPSDTTYRVSDWGRGREIHVEHSMQCIHFEPTNDVAPGADGDTLLVTDDFCVARREVQAGSHRIDTGGCQAWMVLTGHGAIEGAFESVNIVPGQTILIPAALTEAELVCGDAVSYLEITLPQKQESHG